MALTPQQATDMIYRSMLTGVPTAEFDRAGGYQAVYDLAKSSGADMGRPSDDYILRYGPQIASQGYGNMSYSPGFDLKGSLTERGFDPSESGLADGYSNYYEVAQDNQLSKSPRFRSLQDQYGTLNTNYTNLQNQLNALQASYAALQRRGTGNTGSSGTSGGTGVVGDSGTTVDDGSTSGGGTGMDTTMGAVYGPDGTMYSSPAAARAAGVFNYTRVRPVRTNNPATTQTANPNVNASPIGFGGGLINNVVQGDPMTYFTDNAQVGLPAGVRAAF